MRARLAKTMHTVLAAQQPIRGAQPSGRVVSVAEQVRGSRAAFGLVQGDGVGWEEGRAVWLPARRRSRVCRLGQPRRYRASKRQ